MVKIMKVFVSIFLCLAFFISEWGIFDLFALNLIKFFPLVYRPGIFLLVSIYLYYTFSLTLFKLWGNKLNLKK